MSQGRVNIKTDPETRDRLRALKRDGETWDGLLLRAADAVEADQDRDQYPGAPRCTDCGAISHVWTVEGGALVCGVCADGELDAEPTPDPAPEVVTVCVDCDAVQAGLSSACDECGSEAIRQEEVQGREETEQSEEQGGEERRAWLCSGCQQTILGVSEPSECPSCGSPNVDTLDVARVDGAA